MLDEVIGCKERVDGIAKARCIHFQGYTFQCNGTEICGVIRISFFYVLVWYMLASIQKENFPMAEHSVSDLLNKL